MKITKTMRRVGQHQMPMTSKTNSVPQIPKSMGMKPVIRKTRMPKIGYGGFPKGHVY